MGSKASAFVYTAICIQNPCSEKTPFKGFWGLGLMHLLTQGNSVNKRASV